MRRARRSQREFPVDDGHQERRYSPSAGWISCASRRADNRAVAHGPAGTEWEHVLYQKLRMCRGVVALCSLHWIESPWCVAEAMMARERGKPVFLLAAEGSSVPNFLKDLPFIPLSGLPRSRSSSGCCAVCARRESRATPRCRSGLIPGSIPSPRTMRQSSSAATPTSRACGHACSSASAIAPGASSWCSVLRAAASPRWRGPAFCRASTTSG